MELNELYFLSTYLKKWSYSENKFTLNYSFVVGGLYERNRIEMRIGSPVNLLNELLNHAFHRAKERLYAAADAMKDETLNDFTNILLVNESEVKRKLSLFISKIIKEFNQNKRSRGKTRMISIRSLDFYYNDFEFQPLDDEIKFFVHMNRGINKINGDLWSNAVDDLTLALEIKPDDTRANKYMALALHKLGRHEAALKHLVIYAQNEDSPESLDALAKAYIQLGDFEKAEQIYKDLNKRFPDSLLAQYGMAQIAYKLGSGYKSILDRIYKKDPEGLRDKLKKDWDYKIPGYCENEECMWNAATAARYLGFERPFDLTRKAFNEEIPSYFDSERGIIRFVKVELDSWVELMNRYTVDGNTYKTYADRLSEKELEKGKMRRKPGRKKKAAVVEGTEETEIAEVI